MLVADNPLYQPKEQYWMGVGVEYNQSRSIWVNDIAFTLGDRPVSTLNISTLSFDRCLDIWEDPRNKKYMPEAVKGEYYNLKAKKEHEKSYA